MTHVANNIMTSIATTANYAGAGVINDHSRMINNNLGSNVIMAEFHPACDLASSNASPTAMLVNNQQNPSFNTPNTGNNGQALVSMSNQTLVDKNTIYFITHKSFYNLALSNDSLVVSLFNKQANSFRPKRLNHRPKCLKHHRPKCLHNPGQSASTIQAKVPPQSRPKCLHNPGPNAYTFKAQVPPLPQAQVPPFSGPSAYTFKAQVPPSFRLKCLEYTMPLVYYRILLRRRGGINGPILINH